MIPERAKGNVSLVKRMICYLLGIFLILYGLYIRMGGAGT